MRLLQRIVSVCLLLVTTIQTMTPCCASVSRLNSCSQKYCYLTQTTVGKTMSQQCQRYSINNSLTPPIKTPHPKPACPYCQSTAIINSAVDAKIQTEAKSHFIAMDSYSIHVQPQHVCSEAIRFPEKNFSQSVAIAQIERLLI
ncbi:hypothetical protein MNBD_PLANCTO02-3143 [hydrothermal vent metagenome]|uniref:Uncharacterized protein n=1 Tax=hydrothermal vent metagenome TaxID=652676 RepID=A0A3B1E8R8_9ZZZZ